MRNFKLTIEYDGTAYHGWQRQKNDRTVQEEIEKALLVMTGARAALLGSGRTDAGVHALGQTASFRTESRLNADIYFKGLNSLLPDDIVIRECEEMEEGFHARYDVLSKEYRYHILNTPLPKAIGRVYEWHIRKPLDIDAMALAAESLLGAHDFKSFEGTGSPRAHTVREVLKAKWNDSGEGRIFFEIEANGFLRYMVRNIVGTLVAVGQGSISLDGFKGILAAKDRSKAAPTAPPQGLFLVKVKY